MMKRILLTISLMPLITFSQEKHFGKFELLHDIPQQIKHYDNWPKFGLESMQLYSDTLFTLLVKENYLTLIPLSKKDEKIEHMELNIPNKYIPLTMIRNEYQWYWVTLNRGIGFLNKDNLYTELIKNKQNQSAQNIFFISNYILIYNKNGFAGEGIFDLYNINGSLLYSLKRKNIIFMYPIIYNNKIMDGYNEITIDNDIIQVSDMYEPDRYGKEDVFVGGYKNFGYFVNWDSRDCLVIRNLDDKSTQERFIIPVKFKYSDLGIPEEDSINLRVLSEDNNTFYFVTLKHGHLLIYKAVR